MSWFCEIDSLVVAENNGNITPKQLAIKLQLQ